MATHPHLLFIRHAKAEKDHSEGDHVRALTPEGRDAFRSHAQELARLAKVKRILTSPHVRAVQTAELAAAAFG
ncbi:MAG: SixA phosphatase family protein, partial [Myxococcaceae bacterium]